MSLVVRNAGRPGHALRWSLAAAALAAVFIGGFLIGRHRSAADVSSIGELHPSDEVAPRVGEVLPAGSLQRMGAVKPDGSQMRISDVLPADPLQRLDLASDEIPVGYARVCHPDVLKKMGIRQNPDFITKPGDLEAMARSGGLCSFASAVGTGDEVRLILNGVYFRDSKYFDAFVKFQKSRSRRVRAFERAGTDGRWLLMVAIDPELPYSPTEISAIDSCLHRYRERLRLEQVFDQMTNALQTAKGP